MSWAHRWLRRLGWLAAAAALCSIAFVLGGIWDELEDDGYYPVLIERSRYALQSTNLPVDYAVSTVLHGAHSGRDQFIHTIFQADDRSGLMACIRRADGWRTEPITAQDYRDFAAITWYPGFVQSTIADDIVFDAWYYRETTPSAGYEPMMQGRFSDLGRAARGFVFAAFDQETGLFVFIDQFG